MNPPVASAASDSDSSDSEGLKTNSLKTNNLKKVGAKDSRQTVDSLKKIGHWQASLRLEFSKNEKHKTIISDKRHLGPYTIQRPFYPEGDATCHVYLLHPPGGMVSGDQLSLDIHCKANTHALLTTPSAGKVYFCKRGAAEQVQMFTVEEDAILEFLPQEMILFDGSVSDLKTHIRLEKNAQFIGWESIALGRPASKDYFHTGELTQSLFVVRDGMPLLIERLSSKADEDLFYANWGLSNYINYSYFIATHCTKTELENTRQVLEQYNNTYADEMIAAATLLQDVLYVRVLSHELMRSKQCLEQLWQKLRPMILNKAVCMPRIWFT